MDLSADFEPATEFVVAEAMLVGWLDELAVSGEVVVASYSVSDVTEDEAAVVVAERHHRFGRWPVAGD